MNVNIDLKRAKGVIHYPVDKKLVLVMIWVNIIYTQKVSTISYSHNLPFFLYNNYYFHICFKGKGLPGQTQKEVKPSVGILAVFPFLYIGYGGTSLVAQCLRFRLPMQGTWVRSLAWDDPTCCGATKPVRHNDWACILEPASHNYWARVLQLLKPGHLEPVLHSKRSHRNEKPMHRNEE